MGIFFYRVNLTIELGLPQVANRTLTPVTAKTLSPTPLVLFCWTQAFFAILLVLHLRQHVLSLYKVRETLGDTSEADAADSIALMLDWDPRL